MAVIKIKRGSVVPSTSSLESYELAYNNTYKQLYFDDGGAIRKIGSALWRRLVTRSSATTITISASNLSYGKTLVVVLEKYYSGYVEIGQIFIPYKYVYGSTSNSESSNSYEYTTSGRKHTLVWSDLSGYTFTGYLTVTKLADGAITISFSSSSTYKNIYLLSNI